ncbi:MAG: hypothetical protein P0Y52_06755 [Candidatus Brevundimonas phytovorans]|nr:hypothetical protein [Brevundimonas sp.]WEK59237.1 MAG: hypothetical protein P0Y52_06755 [Brevundimonas sp.]
MLKVAGDAQQARGRVRRQVAGTEPTLKRLFTGHDIEVLREQAAAEAEFRELTPGGGAIFEQVKALASGGAGHVTIGLMNDLPVALQGVKQMALACEDDAGDAEIGVKGLGFVMEGGQGRPEAFLALSRDPAMADQPMQMRRRLRFGSKAGGAQGGLSHGAKQHADLAGVVAVELHPDGFKGVLDRAQRPGVGVYRPAETFQPFDGLKAEAGNLRQLGLLDPRKGAGGAYLLACKH